MYGGHQAFYQTEFIIQHFGQRSQAVRGTGSVGDNLHVLVVGVVVYTHNEHRRIGAGRRDNNFLRAAVEVSRSLFGGGEQPVDSTMYSAPQGFQSMSLGSMQLNTVISLPFTTSLPSLADTSPSNLPCTESYLSMYTM